MASASSLFSVALSYAFPTSATKSFTVPHRNLPTRARSGSVLGIKHMMPDDWHAGDLMTHDAGGLIFTHAAAAAIYCCLQSHCLLTSGTLLLGESAGNFLQTHTALSKDKIILSELNRLFFLVLPWLDLGFVCILKLIMGSEKAEWCQFYPKKKNKHSSNLKAACLPHQREAIELC